MQPSLEKLRKFFRLEHENGYSNSAIIGGLAKMLDFWEGEARADGFRKRSFKPLSRDSAHTMGSVLSPAPTRSKDCGSGSEKPIPKRSKSRVAFPRDVRTLRLSISVWKPGQKQ
jgi:hypothetical protein